MVAVPSLKTSWTLMSQYIVDSTTPVNGTLMSQDIVDSYVSKHRAQTGLTCLMANKI